MIGMLAISLAGHDRGCVYVIVDEADGYVSVADGRTRTVDRPKKKNRKHVQIVGKVRIERPEDGFEDLEIRRTIKVYQEGANVKS